MVIGLTSQNGHRAVDLLDGHYSYHLVGKGHLAHGYFAVGSFVYRFAETIRTADYKGQVSSATHFLLQPSSVFNRPKFATMFVQ